MVGSSLSQTHHILLKLLAGMIMLALLNTYVTHRGWRESGIIDQALLRCLVGKGLAVLVNIFQGQSVMRGCPDRLWCALWGGTSWILDFLSVFLLGHSQNASDCVQSRNSALTELLVAC